MKFMEYQAREVFKKYGIPVNNAVVIDNLENIEGKIKNLIFQSVVKAQVQVGGIALIIEWLMGARAVGDQKSSIKIIIAYYYFNTTFVSGILRIYKFLLKDWKY